MLTNILFHHPFGPMMLVFIIGVSILVSMFGGGKWYVGIITGFIVFTAITASMRPPANATPLSDAEIEALFQDQFLGGPHLRKRFFCDENTTIGFTADIPERYLLLAKGRERPIYDSQEKARNCYQQNRQIL